MGPIDPQLADLMTFDGLDNRKTIMNLFVRMGHGLDERTAAYRRGLFLKQLLSKSTNGFSDKTPQITPCSAVEAYHLFLAITSCLGVPIAVAAAELEAMLHA